ncbi:tetratricopeptide repeat protein, partial [Acinetobacter baumannii]
GLVFLDNRQFDIARMYFLNAKKIVGDKPSKNLAIINNNLGIIAYEKKQLQDAIAIYKENEIIAKAVKANALYTMALNNLASCYTEMND